MSGAGLIRFFAIAAIAFVSACVELPRPGEAEVPEGATVTHRAVFIGESNHSTIGTISLYQSEEQPVIVFEPNFELPDPPSNVTVVALGRDGYIRETILGALLRPIGKQAYSVPSKFPISTYNEVWLWSLAKDQPVGLARLTPLL